MIKRIFILCLSILVVGYLIIAITAMNRKPDNEVCKGMELTVKDSIDYGYITPKGIKNILNNKGVKTGGYEQTRLIDSESMTRYYRFDSKYFYMSGINYMLNLYFRF